MTPGPGISRDDALVVVRRAADTIASERGLTDLHVTADTVLIGDGAVFDSVGLVALIMEIEAMADDDYGIVISLTSDRAMSLRESPFRTLGSLAAFIEEVSGGGGG